MAEGIKGGRKHDQYADRCGQADRCQGQQDYRQASALLSLSTNAYSEDYDQLITFFADFSAMAEDKHRQPPGSARLRRSRPNTEIP